MKSVFKILWLLPPVTIFLFIWHLGVDMPYMDQFGTPGNAIIEFSQGTLSFGDLIAQHNESRKLFPRLTFVALAELTGWNTRYEMLLSLILSCGIYWNILQLVKYTFEPVQRFGQWLSVFSIALLIFSPTQYENWLWGIQPITFVPAWAITSCIVALYSQMHLGVIFLICSTVCTVATFSYANGILTWVLIIPLILITEKWRLFPWSKKRILFLIGWVIMTFSNVLIYFHNYIKPGHHPSFLYAVFHPLQSAVYFLSFLGLPLGRWLGIEGSAIVGALSILLFGFCFVRLLRIYEHTSFLKKTLGWQTLAAYTLISGIVTTAGRVGFGVEQSLAGRYVTFSIYWYIAICGLLCILVGHNSSLPRYKKTTLPKNLKPKRNLNANFVTYVCIVMLLTIHGFSSAHALEEAHISKLDRLYGKTCLILIEELPEKECIERQVHPSLDLVQSQIPLFKAADKLSTTILDSKVLQDFNHGGNEKEYVDGLFQHFRIDQDARYASSGWVRRSSNGFTPDSILLAYRNEISGKDIIFKIAGPLRPLDYLTVKAENINKRDYFGWQVSVSESLLPESACVISAWAFDTDTLETKEFKSRFNICR